MHYAGALDGLLVYDSFSLDFIDEIDEALMTLVIGQVVSVHQNAHFVFEVLVQVRADGLRLLYDQDCFICPLLLAQMLLNRPPDFLLIRNTH